MPGRITAQPGASQPIQDGGLHVSMGSRCVHVGAFQALQNPASPLCCHCKIALMSSQAVIALALPPMTAWFDQQLRPGQQPAPLLRHWTAWIAEQRAAGKIQFDVKEPGTTKGSNQDGIEVLMPVDRDLAEMLMTRQTGGRVAS